MPLAGVEVLGSRRPPLCAITLPHTELLAESIACVGATLVSPSVHLRVTPGDTSVAPTVASLQPLSNNRRQELYAHRRSSRRRRADHILRVLSAQDGGGFHVA